MQEIEKTGCALLAVRKLLGRAERALHRLAPVLVLKPIRFLAGPARHTMTALLECSVNDDTRDMTAAEQRSTMPDGNPPSNARLTLLIMSYQERCG